MISYHSLYYIKNICLDIITKNVLQVKSTNNIKGCNIINGNSMVQSEFDVTKCIIGTARLLLTTQNIKKIRKCLCLSSGSLNVSTTTAKIKFNLITIFVWYVNSRSNSFIRIRITNKAKVTE